MANKHALITGGSGFIGSQLIPLLVKDGYSITVLTRFPEQTAKHFNHTVTVIDYQKSLNEENSYDVVINLAGQGIADRRWTPGIKKQLRDSRISTSRKLVDFFQTISIKPDVFISGSAIGYYGIRGNEKITEKENSDNSFSSQLCKDWELEAKRAESMGIRTCYLRTGIVLGRNGGALSKMLPAFNTGLGGPLGNGMQWMSWIHMDDMTGIIRYLIKHKDMDGPVNATSPYPVTNQVFSSTLARVLHRPAFFRMPAFLMKLLLGQMAQELLLSGQRVIPEKLLENGYVFKHTELEKALRNILQ